MNKRDIAKLYRKVEQVLWLHSDLGTDEEKIELAIYPESYEKIAEMITKTVVEHNEKSIRK